MVPKLEKNKLRQYYDTKTRTAHAGENRYGNDIYLGIEFEGRNEDILTKFQVETGAELISWICRTHGIPRIYKLSTKHNIYDFHGFLPHSGVPDQDHSDYITADDWRKMTNAPISAPTPPSSTSNTYTLSFDNGGTMTLRLLKPQSSNYMSGEDVKSWQHLLTAKGFKPGTVDGVYGPASVEAVKRAQTKYKLAVDGYLGASTAEALIEKA